MKTDFITCRLRYIPRFSYLLVMTLGLWGSADAALPRLLSTAANTRAIAVESVTLKHEPFQLTNSATFSTDNRTRIAIFATDLDLLTGETAGGNFKSFTADAQDSAGVLYPLTVE